MCVKILHECGKLISIGNKKGEHEVLPQVCPVCRRRGGEYIILRVDSVVTRAGKKFPSLTIQVPEGLSVKTRS